MTSFMLGSRLLRAAALVSALQILVPGAAMANTVTVDISNFTFDPPEITIHAGDSVSFVNSDDIPHLVVANDGSFRSKALDTGDSAGFTFARAGTFPYFCGLHPHMQGKVLVVP